MTQFPHLLALARTTHRLIYDLCREEVYHLGAQSHVKVSFEIPEYTGDVDGLGATRLLEIIRRSGIRTRFYHAGSSEMFGDAPAPQNEGTAFRPRSPYAAASSLTVAAQSHFPTMQNRLKVLVSAYACQPGKGSEQGIGWNWVLQAARRSDAWVITRVKYRPAIEAALAKEPGLKARFIYFDLPRWVRFWKRRRRGLYLYYYLWQIGAYLVGRNLHQQIGFNIVHHVTFMMHWMPSFLALLPVPFVWGPVGGGEAAPGSFWRSFSRRGKTYELFRTAGQAVGRLDPFVRLTARRAALAVATTPETADRLRELGCRRIEVYSPVGMTADEIRSLGQLKQRPNRSFRIVSIGNLLHLKGFEFGLRAFAELVRGCPGAEYWLIGQGPEQPRLENLARELKVADQVKFWGELPRSEVLEKLAQCDVLVFPSLHDSGGYVCSEAMAAGRPVICLDLGGPALQVTADTGFKIAAISPEQVVRDLVDVLRRLANEPSLRARMGEAARRRVSENLSWDAKGEWLTRIYSEIVATAGSTSGFS